MLRHLATFWEKAEKCIGGERTLAISLILPTAIILGMFSFYPLLSAMWMSLTGKHALLPRANFIGLGNYSSLLKDPDFWTSLGNGLIYAGGTLTLQVAVGTGLALMLNQKFRLRFLARGLLLFPYVIPSIVAVITWGWMFNDIYGIMNHLLLKVGVVNKPIIISTSKVGAMIAVILVGTWRFFPFVTISVLARLQAIQPELYAAAKVDGASVFQRFRYVTLPELRGILFIVILLRGVWMFNEFDTIYLFTRGGPLGSTRNLPLLTYFMAFERYNMGAGCAVAVISFFFLIGVYIIYSKFYTVR